jgi:hypothetical protein
MPAWKVQSPEFKPQYQKTKLKKPLLDIKGQIGARLRWLMTVILGIQEAEIRRITDRGDPI